MEKIFKVKCNELINIGEKFTEYKNELRPDSVATIPETYEEVNELLDLFDGNEDVLEESISINNLAQPDDLPVNEVNLEKLHTTRGQATVEIPKKAMKLRYVRHRIDNQMTGSSSSNEYSSKKYNRYRYIPSDHNNLFGVCDLTAHEDVLITVRVYEPFVYRRNARTTVRKPRLSQEFSVLGCQRLSELRDKIYCYCRFGPFFDISNDFINIIDNDSQQQSPDESPSTSRQKDSGFFFITDTFYNDIQSDVDYSKEIREWMPRQLIGPYQMKSMEDTCFQDLNIRLGFPEVYKHYGNCEHIITFSDIRLLAPDDSLKRSDYPMLKCISSTKMKLCMCCGVMEAGFVVKNSTIHIQDPSYLCKNCVKSLHYVNDEKVGNFQIFRYYGNRPIITLNK